MTTTFDNTSPPTGDDMAEVIADERAVLLRSIRESTPARRANRKRRLIIGGLVAGAITAGGAAAYAALDRPSFVDDGPRSVAREHNQHLDPPHMIKIADLILPDGSRFGAWHGKSKDLECEASTDNWDGLEKTGTGGLSCGPESGRKLIKVHWAAGEGDVTDKDWVPEPWFPVAYGWIPDRAVVRVTITGRLVVTGKTVDLDADVDRQSRGFGVVLPGSVDNRHYPSDHVGEFSGVTLRFLDAEGHEVDDPVPLRVMQ